MLKMSMELMRDGKCVFRLTCVHWWLTGFSMGLFSWPKQLSLNASITFPDCAMMNAFIEGLLKQSYCRCDLTICGLTLTFDMKPLCRHKKLSAKISCLVLSMEKPHVLLALFICYSTILSFFRSASLSLLFSSVCISKDNVCSWLQTKIYSPLWL